MRQRKQVLERDRTQEREEQAWKLRVEGKTQVQIGESLGIPQQTVCDILKRVAARHAEEFRDHAEAVKTRQTEQLEQVYSQAMTAWERSLTEEERQTVVKGRAVVDKFGAVVELPDVTTISRVGKCGDPALLAQAMKALAEIRAIWGLDAPKKVDATTGGEPFKVYGGFDPGAV